MIKLIIGLPLVGYILNNIIPNKIKISREINMLISILTLYLVFWFILKYNNNSNEFQFREVLLENSIFRWSLGVDGISLSLILLMSIIEPILLLLTKGEVLGGGEKEEVERKRLINLILITKLLIFILFLSLDLFIFFISFELILIPMFLIISRYGSKYKYFLPRLEAGLRFFLYTMIGSILMLISIIIFFIKYGSTSNELLNLKINNDLYNSTILGNNSLIFLFNLLWIFIFFSFLIKVPMFPFHTWLPLAHSDSPTIGSVILAALLLKLASFGILRYSLYLFQPLNTNFLGDTQTISVYNYVLPIIFVLSIISIIYCSFITIRSLFDFKKIIAYSSIVHMNFSIFGFFSKELFGLIGASFLMFTHAFISSSLFLLVGFLYKRYHTRYILYYHGLMEVMPVYSFFFLFFSLANISLPFFSSFISEFFILISTIHFNPFISLILLLSLVLSTSFVMWFTNRILFGNLTTSLKIIGFKDLTLLEFSSILPFFFFTLFFAFFPQTLIDLLLLPLTLFI